MTQPDERTRSLIQTEKFLTRLGYSRDVKHVPEHVREEARRCLRHFPTCFDVIRGETEFAKVFDSATAEAEIARRHEQTRMELAAEK